MTQQVIGKKDRQDYFITESGIELRLKKVSRFIVTEVGKKILMPKVPVVYIEDKERMEENPNDPDYRQALIAAQNERGALIVTSVVALGTEVARLPEGIAGPLDDEWIEVLEGVDLEIDRKNQRLRYAAWLKYIALPDGPEFDALITKVFRFSGLTAEADVKDASDAFPSDEEQHTNNGRAVEPKALN